MYVGSVGAFSNDEEWRLDGLLLDDDGEEVTLTGATLEFYIAKEQAPRNALLTATTADGKITLPTATSFQILFDPEDVADLVIGTYSAFLKVTISGVRTQIISGTVQVIEGGPR